MVAAGTLLAEVVARALLPREKLAVDAWADRHVKIPAQGSAESGAWSTDRTPYLRRPMNLFTRRGKVRAITFMSGSQVGKTSLVDILKLYAIAEQPGPTLVMYPNIEAARDYNQDRFIPTLKLCAPAAAHLRPSPQDTKNLKISLDNGTLWFVGSNSPQGRRMRPCRYVFADEVGAFEDLDWTEVFERVKTFEDACIVCTSTPTNEGSGIEPLFQEGSRERFWVPCPHCGRYQIMAFPQLRWDRPDGAASSGAGAISAARASARYECPAPPRGCGGRVYDYHKPAMLARGVWIAQATAEAEGVGSGVRTVTEEQALRMDAGAHPPPEHASFQLSGLYSPFPRATLGDMAGEFAAAGMQVTPKFVRGWLGESWRALGDRLEVAELKRLCAPVAAGGYRLGEVPAWVVALVLTADIQKSEVYVEVRGWGAYGRDTCLVQRLIIPRVEGRGLIELDDERLVPRVYRRIGTPELVRAPVEGVDSGNFTVEVYQYIRRRRARGVNAFAIKGAGLMPHSMRVIDRWPDGTPMPGGCPLLSVNEDVWATDLMGRVKGRPGLEEHEEGGLERAAELAGSAGVVRGFYLPEQPAGELEEYILQLTSMERAVVLEKKTQRPHPRRGVVYQWRMRAGAGRNEFFDTCKYNCALADYLGIARWAGKPAGAAGAAKRGAAGGRESRDGGREGEGWVSRARRE